MRLLLFLIRMHTKRNGERDIESIIYWKRNELIISDRDRRIVSYYFSFSFYRMLANHLMTHGNFLSIQQITIEDFLPSKVTIKCLKEMHSFAWRCFYPDLSCMSRMFLIRYQVMMKVNLLFKMNHDWVFFCHTISTTDVQSLLRVISHKHGARKTGIDVYNFIESKFLAISRTSEA